jgi:hypothetical protein
VGLESSIRNLSLESNQNDCLPSYLLLCNTISKGLHDLSALRYLLKSVQSDE